MALEDIAGLEKIGKVTLEKDKKEGSHVVTVEVSQTEPLNALGEVSKYLVKQKGIKVDSLKYADGSVVINYSDVKEGSSKARGSPGCGSSMFPSYRQR